jgi:predicted naringenin-chalcone synthase
MNREPCDRSAPEGAYLAAIGVATPDFAVSQQEAVDFLLQHYAGMLSARNQRLVKKIFAHPGINRRSLAMDGLQDLLGEDQDRRIERFTRHAVALAAKAMENALAEASCRPEQVTALIVNTCTGYICPGLSTYLIEELGLSKRVQAFDLVGGGCGGAIPNLQLAEALLRVNSEAVVLSVCVEICTATFQMGDDLSLLVSNAIFGDGAAAVLVTSRPGAWRIIAFANLIEPAFREEVRYVYKNGQLHNQLAGNLPELVNRYASQVVAEVLQPRGLGLSDIRFWALHPGGEKIITEVKQGLRLTEEQLLPTRSVLSGYGNMSSPTVLFVLREICRADPEPDEYCMMVAYGAGLSAHALLLQKNNVPRADPGGNRVTI